jgi:hypothetical protein
MSHTFANQVRVRVWRNVKYGGLPGPHFGHAAVVLHGGVVAGYSRDAQPRVQISFWPGDFAKIGPSALQAQASATTGDALADKRNEMGKWTALRLEIGYRDRNGIPVPDAWRNEIADVGYSPIDAPRSGQSRNPDSSYVPSARGNEGYRIWSQSPELKLDLPGFRNPGLIWGLSLTRCAYWWMNFKNSEPHYKALSFQNCAGVALMALREAGSEAFAELPHVQVYAEPTQVENYAGLVKVQQERMEAWTATLDADIRQALETGQLKAADAAMGLRDLWPVADWMKASALGPFQPRGSTIRAIDKALSDYHASSWSADYKTKYQALVKVFLGIGQHRQDKADSARSVAVLTLAFQLLKMMRNPGPHEG